MESSINYYQQVQSIDQWVNTIETKFMHISLSNYNEIARILDINDELEIDKIKQAFLIVLGKKIGILSFEDACIKLGRTNMIFNTNYDDKQDIANKKLKIIVEVINGEWKTDWNDANQYKYYPWFDMRGDVSFDSVGNSWNSHYSVLGSRLCLKDIDTAFFIGNYFIDLYRDFLN